MKIYVVGGCKVVVWNVVGFFVEIDFFDDFWYDEMYVGIVLFVCMGYYVDWYFIEWKGNIGFMV